MGRRFLLVIFVLAIFLAPAMAQEKTEFGPVISNSFATHWPNLPPIMKGIAVMLCEFYSGQTPEEIAAIDPSFLREVGITQHLTPNRRNGLARIWERIRAFAVAQQGSLPSGAADEAQRITGA